MNPIIKKVTLNAPVSKVWNLLIDAEKLGEWMMMPTNINPSPGKEFTFQGPKSEQWDGIIRCKIKDLVENKRMSFTWNSNTLNGETLVTIELKENAGKTDLTLTHSGWENLPANQEMMREAHDKGWDERVLGLLPGLAEKK
jgi:uncharacterized protein YndB with AHSA1/START domain